MKVSIITACFNRVDTIEKCLASISSQSFKDIEYIIIDGASNDGTLEMLKKSDVKIDLLISENDNGIYDALNKGIINSTGEIIGILHSDDVYAHKNVISEITGFFESNPNVEIVFGNVNYFKKNNSKKPIRTYKSNYFKKWMFIFGFTPAHTAAFIKKSVFDRHGLYRDDFKYAGDFEFFLRVLLVFSTPYALLNQTFINMQMGGKSNLNLKSYVNNTREIIFALKTNGIISNFFLVSIRFPIKILWIIICKFKL